MRRFFILFVILQVVLFGIELLGPVQQHVIVPFTSQLANLCTTLIHMFDSQAVSQGKVVYNPINGFGVSIEAGCNGVEACIVLISAVLAFPSSWKHKFIGIAMGLAAVQALNVVRIISLFYLGQWDMAWFDFFHSFLWQALIMLDVLVIFLIWVRRFALRQPPALPPPPPHALATQS